MDDVADVDSAKPCAGRPAKASSVRADRPLCAGVRKGVAGAALLDEELLAVRRVRLAGGRPPVPQRAVRNLTREPGRQC